MLAQGVGALWRNWVGLALRAEEREGLGSLRGGQRASHAGEE